VKAWKKILIFCILRILYILPIYHGKPGNKNRESLVNPSTMSTVIYAGIVNVELPNEIHFPEF